MENALQNRDLWVGIDSRGMPFISELDLMGKIIDQVRKNTRKNLLTGDILSVQKVVTKHPVHIIYCRDINTRDALLSCVVLKIETREYELINFQSDKIRGLGETSLRVSVNGLPFSVTDEEIQDWIDTWASRSSKVKKAMAKSNEDGPRHLLNGNRFCYINNIREHQPRYSLYKISDPINPVTTVDIHLTVYYDGQPINCRKCLSLNHESRNCNPIQSHPENDSNLEMFRGPRHPLSNLYPVQIQFDNNTFPTAEHIYQYQKATTLGLHDEAKRILTTTDPLAAMLICENATKGHNTTQWDAVKVKVMRHIMDLKYSNCIEFRHKLRTSDKILVETTKNKFWASGLPPKETAETPSESWPGQNKLGEILMNLRVAKQARDIQQEFQTPLNNSGALDIAQALITKVLDPHAPHTISSEELLNKADNIISSSVKAIVNDLESVIKHGEKRKDISPINNEDKQKTKKQVQTIDQYFTPGSHL